MLLGRLELGTLEGYCGNYSHGNQRSYFSGNEVFMTRSHRKEDPDLSEEGRIRLLTVKQKGDETRLRFDPLCKSDRETGVGEELGETRCDHNGTQEFGRKLEKNSRTQNLLYEWIKNNPFPFLLNSKNTTQLH